MEKSFQNIRLTRVQANRRSIVWRNTIGCDTRSEAFAPWLFIFRTRLSTSRQITYDVNLVNGEYARELVSCMGLNTRMLLRPEHRECEFWGGTPPVESKEKLITVYPAREFDKSLTTPFRRLVLVHMSTKEVVIQLSIPSPKNEERTGPTGGLSAPPNVLHKEHVSRRE